MQNIFKVRSNVKIFPQVGGWYYVLVPEKYSQITKPLADRGLVAIIATVGSITWDTSLLPMGDGTHFIALPARVRKIESINLGEKITVSFVLRIR